MEQVTNLWSNWQETVDGVYNELSSSSSEDPSKPPRPASMLFTDHLDWFNKKQKSSTNESQTSLATDSAPMPPPKPKKTSSSSSFYPTSQQLTDKLVEAVISMILPTDTSQALNKEYINDRVIIQRTRPSLSVPIITKNTIQLLQRLAIPFELIDEVIRVFSWTKPTYTIGLLIIYTHLVLNPILIVSLPFFYLVFQVMVPAYLVKHPPEISSFLPYNPIPADGPALSNVEVPKPAPEISREFILNVTDLQNHTLLYVAVYDFFSNIITGFGYWQDESISSFAFLVCLGMGIGNLLVLPYVIPFLPIKFFLIIFVWIVTIAFHPSYRNFLFEMIYSEETRIRLLTTTNDLENLIKDQFEFYEPQEQREVEIFEIQQLNKKTKQWELMIYSNDFYTYNTVCRSNLKLPQGVESLSLVKPPLDWDFVNGNWKLDLNPNQWVNENYLFDLCYVDGGEKWVYDLINHEEEHKTKEPETTSAVEKRFSWSNYAGMDQESNENSIYRRRRWVRICNRLVRLHEEDDSFNKEEAADTTNV